VKHVPAIATPRRDPNALEANDEEGEEQREQEDDEANGMQEIRDSAWIACGEHALIDEPNPDDDEQNEASLHPPSFEHWLHEAGEANSEGEEQQPKEKKLVI
jgi:hypothetical protein